MSQTHAPASISLESFAARFGRGAASGHPDRYRLMILAPDGGIVVQASWEGMLASSFAIARHEDAFAWAAMASPTSGSSIHASLLECLMFDCLQRAGIHACISKRACKLAFDQSEAPSATFDAVAILDTRANANNRAAIATFKAHASQAVEGSETFEIPDFLCLTLIAKFGERLGHREQAKDARDVFEAAWEAIALGASARISAQSAPAPRL